MLYHHTSPAYMASEQVRHQGSDVVQHFSSGQSIVLPLIILEHDWLDLMSTGNYGKETMDNKRGREYLDWWQK